jgi:hypothetical protein
LTKGYFWCTENSAQEGKYMRVKEEMLLCLPEKVGWRMTMDSMRDRYFSGATVTVGPRSPETGVTVGDKVVFDAVTGRDLPIIFPDESFDSIKARLGEQTLVHSGGIANKGAMLQVHGLTSDRYQEPLKVGDFQRALQEGWGSPYNFDYAASILKAIRRAEQEVGSGVFRRIHGFDESDYLEMPYTESQKVGRIKASTEAGIFVPTWDFVRRHADGRIERVFESAPVPYKPEDVLPCIALGVMGRSVLNPQRLAWVTIGDRGYSTPLGNALFTGLASIAYPGREGVELQGIKGLSMMVSDAMARFDEATAQGLPIKMAVFLIKGVAQGNRPIEATELVCEFIDPPAGVNDTMGVLAEARMILGG